MRKNITQLNDTRAWRVGARARGETTGKTCGSFDRVRLDAVQKPMERGVHATTTNYYRERERRDDVLTDAIFSARDDTGGYGARSGDYR